MELDRTRGVWGATVVVVVFAFHTSDSFAQGRTGTQTQAQEALKEANAELKAKNYKDAFAKYREAIAKDPQLAEAYERFSMALFSKRQYSEGAMVARKGLDALPGNDAIRASLGMNLLKMKRVAAAHKHLKPVVSALPARFEIQASAAQCCLKVKDYPCAVAALKNFLKNRPKKLSKRDHVFRSLLGTALLEQGDYRRAGRVFQKVIQTKPKYTLARTGMAEVYLRSGDCSRAVASYERLRADGVKQKDLPLKLGQSYLCSRRFRAAFREGDRFVKGHPRDVEGLLLRGEASAQLKWYDKAIVDFNKVASIAGKERVRLQVAQVYYLKRRYRKALEELQPMLVKPGVDAGVLILGLRAAVRTRKKALALAYGEKLLKVPKKNADTYYYAGMAHSSKGQFDRAVELYDKALELSKTHRGSVYEMIKALCYMGRQAKRKGQWEQVIEQMQRAHRVDPKSLVVNRNLALAYMQQGKNKRAHKHLSIILRKVPRDPVANRMAGRVLMRLGRAKEARMRFTTAVNVIRRVGGVDYARALAESAVALINVGQLDLGLLQLEKALSEAQGKPKGKRLVKDIQRNLARVYVMKSRKSLDDNKAKQAYTDLQKALKVSAQLPPDERLVVQAAAAISALSVGQVAKGKELAKKLKGKMGKVLVPPFNKIGDKLLAAYADYLTPGAKAKLAAGAALAKMAARLKPPAKNKLLNLARSAYEQTAVLLFRAGRKAQAQRALAKASRLTRGVTPQQKHNLAVINYLAGKRQASVATLGAVQGKVPMAKCNLAVHHEMTGSAEKAFQWFVACQRAGARYPGLNEIVKAKKRVFGAGP